MSYRDLREKYRITDEEAKLFKVIERKRAFDDLDAAIEEYDMNGKSRNNGGRKFEPTDEEVELILDEYLEWRYADFAIADEVDDMRRSVQNVMGLIL